MAFLTTLRHALLATLVAHQYPGLFVLLLIEEAGVPLPLPGDTLIMYEGARARAGHANAALVLLLVSAAAALGSSALYALARWRGRPAVLRYGRVFHLHPERVDRLAARYRRWGAWAIILGRLIPGLRTPTSVMAGLVGVPYRLFVPCTALSALIWTVFYFYLGVFLEPSARRAVAFARRDLDDALVALVLLVLVVAGVAVGLRRARATRPARPDFGDG